MVEHKHTVENLEKAFSKAKNLEWENGMATLPVYVEREHEIVRVIRKCVNPKRPEIFLIQAEPNVQAGVMNVNIPDLEKDVKDALDLYGDIQINFQPISHPENSMYSCVINTF